jgi:chromosome segregation ATPase
MRPVLEKLFGSGRDSAKTSQRSAIIQELGSKTASAPEGDAFSRERDEGSALKSEDVSCTFDSIGRRNETLRAQLESIEFSFRDIEAIRTRFHDALTSIDQTLVEIERTKVAHLEAQRKLENLAAANDRLQRDRAGLTLERDALTVAQNELLARASDLEQLVTAREAASAAALAVLAERSAKLEQTERDLDDNRRALHALSEQLRAIRTEIASKETRLREVEQQRAALNDHCDLLTQENDALRTRTEELVVDASKLSRQLSELRDERDELRTSFDHETAAHAKLKAAHFEAIEAQRLSQANLQEKLSATTRRLKAAEQLLVEARVGMHEQDATIREFEQRVLDKSLEAKSLEAQVADLEKDLASARAGQMEAEVARTVGVEQSTTLAKSLHEKEVALQRAEQKVATVEAKFDGYKKATVGDRALFEEKIAKLTEQLEAESAARLFAEGALRSARQERSARRHDDVLAESSSAETESADSKIMWLRR